MRCSCTAHNHTHTCTRNPTCNRAHTGSAAHAAGCTVSGGNPASIRSTAAVRQHTRPNKQTVPGFPQSTTPLKQATHRRPGLLRGAAVHTIHTRQQHTQQTHSKLQGLRQQTKQPGAMLLTHTRLLPHSRQAAQGSGVPELLPHTYIHPQPSFKCDAMPDTARAQTSRDTCQCCCTRLQVLCMWGQALVCCAAA